MTRANAISIAALLGLLGALTGPAIIRAREGAAKASCQDRLRVIGAALHAYHDVHGTLPTYRTTTPKKHGWMPMILPQLGRDDLARRFRRDVHWYQQDANFLAEQMNGLYCPDAGPARTSTAIEADGIAWTAACTDYAAFSTLNVTAAQQYPPGADLTGAMPRDFYRKLSGIGDGTSYTLMVGEIARRPQEWHTGPQLYAPMQAFPNKGPWAAELNHINPRGHTLNGDAPIGPCAVNCNNTDGVFAVHPRGANVVLCDGSVRFLRDTLGIDVLFALVTANYGEPLATADF